jgi:uncharacterized protein (DUF1015 family)
MPLVKPFRALRYDVRRAGAIGELVAPPWDVITSEMLDRLASASPYNVIRLIRPHDWELAARRLADWIDTGVLVREERPAVWRIEEAFVGPDGVSRVRHGLVARVRLEPYAAGIVFPHERIFPAQSEARLALLRATRTKLSPVLLLHEGHTPPSVERQPDLRVTLEGTETRLWRLDDPETIAAAVAGIRSPLVIADGHHRYDAALRFHEEEGSDETAYVMAALVSARDEGLTIFPTHRVVSSPVPELNGDFRLTPLAGAGEGLARLQRLSRDHPAFVLLRPRDAVLAELLAAGDEPLERLDVAALDRLGLDGVTFTPDARDAEEAVRSGRAAAAFLVRAPTVTEVEEIARAGKTMPEKSTYFFPKLTSGLLLSPFDE